MKTYFLNGKFVKENKAKIGVENLGILRGYGVFDYIRTYEKVPFYIQEHLIRLFHSAKAIGLKVPLSKKQVESVIFTLIKKNKGIRELNFRIVLSGGKTSDGKTAERPDFFIIVGKAHNYPELFYKKGIKLLMINYHREFPEIKSLNYCAAISNWEKTIKSGAQEILYVFQNKVFECSTSNFFIVKNKIIYTPLEGILKGITRAITIKLAKRSGMLVREKKLSLKEVLSSDEAFITATSKKILPVIEIGKHKINKGKVGKTTKILMENFDNLIKLYFKDVNNKQRN